MLTKLAPHIKQANELSLKSFIKIIDNYKNTMALETGSNAPDFTLKHKNADGLQQITLSSNYGEKKTVLLFTSAAFCCLVFKTKCEGFNF